MYTFIEVLKAILFGIIEGITEWLPVSSTGHMILLSEFVRLDVSDAFWEMFLVVVQLGAIIAVPILFWDKLVPFSKKKSKDERKSVISLWCKVIVGVIPAALLGILFDDFFDEHFYNFPVVSIALVIYGVAFIAVESLRKNKHPRIDSVYDLSYRDALIIGGYQVLSLIPGTSRSGATILGALLIVVSRKIASEYTFFLAIPVMFGASLLKLLKFGFDFTGIEMACLLAGCVVAFVVSVFILRFLLNYIKKHDFKVFGWYRIVLGIVVLAVGMMF